MSVLTCPFCGYRQDMEIPEGKCIPFYTCRACARKIQAKDKCCVFCEFGDKKCPVHSSS